jgi:hypothetical protein
MKEDKMAGICGTRRKKRNAYRLLVIKPKEDLDICMTVIL